VRSKTEGKGDNREEKFYLSKLFGGLEGGLRKRRSLQGRGILHDTSKLIKRLLGSVFLLMGVGLFVYESPNVTGAVIGNSTTDFIVGGVFILLALGLFFIKSKKSNKKK
jgi:hypothetical protein